MKKILFTLAAMLMTVLPSEAMSYEQARQQALFLADKMAYELNLTEEQYEAVYEINLDYLMSVNSYDDVYGVCWTHRNLDLSFSLTGNIQLSVQHRTSIVHYIGMLVTGISEYTPDTHTATISILEDRISGLYIEAGTAGTAMVAGRGIMEDITTSIVITADISE